MGVCEAKLGLGLASTSPSPSSSCPAAAATNAAASTAALEALNGEFGNLRLEEKSDSEDNENKTTEENVNFDKDSASSREGKGDKFCYPVRPDEPGCSYYLKTGTCRYGTNCKFNHPERKKKTKANPNKSPEPVQKVVSEEQKESLLECSEKRECKDVEEKERETSSEILGQTECKAVEMQKESSSGSVGQTEHKAVKEKKGILTASSGQTECKYYSMPGGCKYGKACRYVHPREKTEVASVELNFLGLPMRPGEKECPYYMRTGGCKYSTNCRFHHPDPTAVGGQDPLSGYQNGGSSQQHASPAQQPVTSWPLQRGPNEPVPFLDTPPSYVPGIFIPPQGLHPNPEWNGYQAPVNPMFPPEMSMQHPSPAFNLKDTTSNANGPVCQRLQVDEYPERPGQPECHYFMKNGSCKFKTSCRFHHPKSRLSEVSGVTLSPMGLPLQPDQPVCAHYSRYRICKYGRACKFDHPMDCTSPAPAVAAVTVVGCGMVVGSTDAPIQESEW